MTSPVSPVSVHLRAERHPTLAEWVGDVAFLPLTVSVQPGWSRFNPSLATRSDGSLCGVIRSSNYRMENGRYVMDDGDGAIRTINYLVDLNDDVDVTNPRMIVAPPDRVVSDFPVHGYEDVRLAPIADGLWALCTVRDSDASGVCRIALLQLAGDGQVLTETFVDGPTPGRHEKNWAPFVGEHGELCVVYSWDPLVVASIELDPGVPSGERLQELSRTVSGLGANVRGGTNGVPVDGGWLFLVHESRRFPDGHARYVHRFVTVRNDFTVGAVSPLLNLMTDGVEFAMGVAKIGDDLLLGFGLEDVEAWVAKTTLARVLDGLSELEQSGAPQ